MLSKNKYTYNKKQQQPEIVTQINNSGSKSK